MNSKVRREGVVFCLVGPAGSGKTTLGESLTTDVASGITFAISCTSRPPRSGEQNGIDYHFVSVDEFQEKLDRGEFFESELIHGHYYGMLKSEIEPPIQAGSDLLLDIDIRGAQSFKRAYPRNSVSIFVVPPSFAELRRRLDERGAESKEDRQARYQTAKSEYATLLSPAMRESGINYLIVNDNRERALEVLSSIISAERARLSRLAIVDLEQICQVHE